MTHKEFTDGWSHFCGCINFAVSGLDAEAIRFMNEMPSAVRKGLNKDKMKPILDLANVSTTHKERST